MWTRPIPRLAHATLCAKTNGGSMPFLGRQGYSEDECLGVQVEAAFVGVLILPEV